MLIPQFSIRMLIVVTAIVAVLAMIASWGGQGIAWAIGATAAIGMVLLAMLVQAAMFGLVWLASPLVRHEGPSPSAPAPPSDGEPSI